MLPGGGPGLSMWRLKKDHMNINTRNILIQMDMKLMFNDKG